MPARRGRKPKEEAGPVEVVKLRIITDFLIDAPVYTEKYGGRGNWLARITLDAMAPGGLDRKFCERGKGACLYIIDELQLFDAVEFAADTTAPGSPRKRRERWFGVVVAKTDGYILVERWEKPASAILRSQSARTNPVDRIRALQEQRGVLMIEVERLDAEIQELSRLGGSQNVIPLEPRGDVEVRRDVEAQEGAEGQDDTHPGHAVVEADVALVGPPVPDVSDITDPEAVLNTGLVPKSD